MNKYVVLLRGINVGGHNKIKMTDLKLLLKSNGFTNVSTYIQSGNIILTTKLETITEVSKSIGNLISEQFQYNIKVIVKTSEQFQGIFNANPFKEDVILSSYYILFNREPSIANVEKASEKQYDYDIYNIIEDCLYLHPTKGYGKSKFNLKYFEKQLEVSATARNYKTMLKLSTMLNEN